MKTRSILSAALAASFVLALAACEREGPVERAGEEVDEAIDTLKRGGDESAESKADDALDEARDAIEDATDGKQ